MPRHETPLLNLTGTVRWRDRWWLLDAETSGRDRQKDDIIALRLACMEEYSVTQEQEILIRPRRPLRPWVEGVTGISNQALEQAAPLDAAINRLEGLDGPLLFLDRDFTLPFLQNAFLRCGRAFSKPCLLLDRFAARLLDCSPRQKTDQFQRLPPPNGLCGTPPQDPALNELYTLSLAVFHALEESQNTVDRTDFEEQETYL